MTIIRLGKLVLGLAWVSLHIGLKCIWCIAKIQMYNVKFSRSHWHSSSTRWITFTIRKYMMCFISSDTWWERMGPKVKLVPNFWLTMFYDTLQLDSWKQGVLKKRTLLKKKYTLIYVQQTNIKINNRCNDR